MSHRLKTARQRIETGGNISFSGRANIEALTLAKNDSERVSERSLTCQSPVCKDQFEQTGIERLEPRKYCDKDCRMDAWAIRRTAALFGLTVERMVELLKGKL
jgi:hypothetical protein